MDGVAKGYGGVSGARRSSPEHVLLVLLRRKATSDKVDLSQSRRLLLKAFMYNNSISASARRARCCCLMFSMFSMENICSGSTFHLCQFLCARTSKRRRSTLLLTQITSQRHAYPLEQDPQAVRYTCSLRIDCTQNRSCPKRAERGGCKRIDKRLAHCDSKRRELQTN